MRTATAYFAALAALATCAIAAPVELDERTINFDLKGLRNLALLRGKYFGTATNGFQIVTPPNAAYVPLLESQFDAYTPENEMKWEDIEPTQGNFDFTGADQIIAESKKSLSLVRGHNFVWHQQTPAYVTSITDPTELKAVLKNHIDVILGRYKNDLKYFDVINEPLNDDGTLRSSVWLNVLGDDYFEIALRYAHAAAPNLKLCINDYNIETVSPKSQAMAALANKLLGKGVPLHCIGFESHFIGGQTPQDIPAAMQLFTSQGLEVPLTELDVRIQVNSSDVASASQLALQTADYVTAVNACLGNKLCPGITVWQFPDPVSWIPAVFPGYGAADLYDNNYKPKPAYKAVQKALVNFFK